MKGKDTGILLGEIKVYSAKLERTTSPRVRHVIFATFSELNLFFVCSLSISVISFFRNRFEEISCEFHRHREILKQMTREPLQD